jgi:hypothetical protein
MKHRQALLIPVLVALLAAVAFGVTRPAAAATPPDAALTVEDLRAFERRHGDIPRDAVLMYSALAMS